MATAVAVAVGPRIQANNNKTGSSKKQTDEHFIYI